MVKRFKEMNGVGREDFAEHMRRLGRLAHPNLLPVVAYLYKKEKKLLVTDMANGSLAQNRKHVSVRVNAFPLAMDTVLTSLTFVSSTRRLKLQ